ncbi:hypothetical protein Bca52824_004261 [Brassica carinata]|uniref:Uncharacterized protein n=1 Tax=Brassica carinata TaxID=52824 RepID=A0A8X7WP53_BRACI|nr:hypothetical protein Bca52824_004261 [Brassica carinata]
MSSLFCRASSKVAALPFRAVRSPVSLQAGAHRVTLGGGSHQFSRASSSLISCSRGSTLTAITADENLVSVLGSKIKCSVVNEAPEDDELPEWFPFRFVDAFEDETIYVRIELAPNDPQTQVLNGIPMFITVTKQDDGPSLEFVAKAYVDEIVIDVVYFQKPYELSFPYQGPHDFADLYENLLKAFHRFLEIRGIKPTITEFVADYMANKDGRERLQWLNDIKSFVDM